MRRFDESRDDNTAMDRLMCDAFMKTRWLEIKRVYKLCDNDMAPKRGDPNYNPAYKYDLVYNVICHNVNVLTKNASLDQCMDESTFPFQGFGEAKTGLVGNIVGKPGVSNGAQVLLCTDVDRIRPRAYVHRHKLHQKKFNVTGQNEVYLMMRQLESLVVDETTETPVGIFTQKPHIMCDNFFSGDLIFQYAAENDWGLLMTCRRDRLPKGVPGKY